MDRRDRPDSDFDGVRVTAHPRRRRYGLWLLLAVVAIAAGAGWLLSGQRWAGPRTTGAGAVAAGGDPMGEGASVRPAAGAAGPDSALAAAPGEPSESGRRRAAAGASPAVADGEDPTPDLSDYVLPGEAPEMAQVIEALHARGIRTGLGAFQPPGTSPPLRGLLVPDDFPLPDGYVRHHQATDDGQRIAPILMFAPDRDTVVVRGAQVPVPANRVVPPELAPPGLPLRWVVIPAPRDGGGSP